MPAPYSIPKFGQFKTPSYGVFNGGLNTRDFWHTLKDNELVTARNIRLDEGGVIRKRGGWVKVSSTAVGTAGNLKGVYQAAWISGLTITRRFIATDGVTVWHGTGGAWTDITGAVVLTSPDSMIVSMLMFNNVLIGYDGVNSPWQWDGSAGAISSVAGSPPISNIGIVWQGRLWFARGVRLHYSGVDDQGTWGASAYIDVPSPFDGEEITGLAVLYGNLIIFKRHSIYLLQGDSPDNFVLSKLNAAVGCVSPYSVLAVDNLVYFVSDKGLYGMNLSNAKHLAYKVEPNYHRAVNNQLLGSLARNRIQAVHYRRRNELWVAVDATAAGQDQHDRMMVHNYAVLNDDGDPAVVEHTLGGTATAPAVLAEARDATTGVVVPIASFYDKYVYRYSEAATNDADAAGTDNFSSVFKTGYKHFGDADATKTLRNIWTNITFAAGTPKISIGKLAADLSSETYSTLTPSDPTTFYNTKQPAASILSAPQAQFFAFGMTSDDGGTFSFFDVSFDVINNGRRN